jgi:hypothetical protein
MQGRFLFPFLGLLLLAEPGMAAAQSLHVAGPYPIDRQPGETLAAALHRAMEMRLRLPPGMGPALTRPAAPASLPAPPSIISGKILTPSINVQKAPGTPKIQIHYASPGYLYSVVIGFAPSFGYQWFTTYYQAIFPESTGGVATLENGYQSGFYNFTFSLPSLYAAAGPWHIYSIAITDWQGQVVTYTGDQLASLFPSLILNVVNNGASDSVPPTISAGKLLTPTVQLSSANPVFEAQLAAKDNLSGVAQDYTGMTLVTPDGTSFYYTGSNATEPLLSGTVTTGIDFAVQNNAPPTGTWTIGGYVACDVVHNCTPDTSPEDIKALFGTTTFNVTP